MTIVLLGNGDICLEYLFLETLLDNSLIKKMRYKPMYREYYPITESSYNIFIKNVDKKQLNNYIEYSILLLENYGIHFLSAEKLLDSFLLDGTAQNTDKNREILNRVLSISCVRF